MKNKRIQLIITIEMILTALLFVLLIVTLFLRFIVPILDYNPIRRAIKKSDTYENEEFCYRLINSDDGTKNAIITKVKPNGTDVLIIPKEIDGHKVVSVGYYGSFQSNYFKGFGEYEYVYIPYEVAYYSPDDIFKDSKEKKLGITIILENFVSVDTSEYGINFVSFPRGTNVKNLEKLDGQRYDYDIASIIFSYNYDTPYIDDIYFYFSKEKGENNDRIVYVPDNPTREGYTFTGWYKEEECINLYDFSEKLSSDIYDITIFYHDRLEILYAGWKENE